MHSPSSSLVPLSLLPADPTFTLTNVTTAVESVEHLDKVGVYLDVPSAQWLSRDLILQYIITTLPDASWQTLAGALYYLKHDAALTRVTKYFQPQPGI